MLETVVDHGGVTVICQGPVLRGITVYRFGRYVMDALAQHRRVVVDLSGVTQLDAGGIGTLADVIRHAKERGRCLAVATTAGRIRTLLQLTALDTQVEWLPLEQVQTLTQARTGPCRDVEYRHHASNLPGSRFGLQTLARVGADGQSAPAAPTLGQLPTWARRN